MKAKKGFTLIELLVVISIIALLLSVLMPALNRAKKMAQQVICMSTLKQNGTTIMTYASDNKDSFTRGKYGWDGQYGNDGGAVPSDGFGYWMSDLKPYRGEDVKALVCAAVQKVNPRYSANHNDYVGWKNYSAAWGWTVEGMPSVTLNTPIPVSFTMSVWATNPDQGSWIGQTNHGDNGVLVPYEYCWKKVSNVVNAANVPIFGDGRWLEGVPLSPTRVGYNIGPAALMPPKTESDAEFFRGGSSLYDWGLGQFCVPRHPSKTINLVFADGSTRKVGLTDLWRLKWYRQFDTNNTYANGTSKFWDWIAK
jgi:prepilin-type N-terminal cleavage/methylation domain-containing protein